MALALGLALASGALAAPEAKITALPPYAAAYQPQTVDERGMWAEADEFERQLRDSPAVIADPALNAYVRHVLCTAVGPDRCGQTRIYIVRMPVFNASMHANGLMTVYTGLLLRARSEAELAAVLGHEFGHFELRHTLAGFREARGTSDVLMWLAIAGGTLRTSMPGAAYALTDSLYRFNRDQERAADAAAFRYMAASPYRPGAAADMWEGVMAERDATALGRKQRLRRHDRISFADTHPPTLERARTLRAMAVADGDDGVDERAAYAAAMAAWRPQFIADQLKLNDFGGSEYLLKELAADGWSADLLFARGELYRMRGHPRDLVAAAGFYREAIAAGSTEPLARRGLGLALLRSGQAAEGKAALADYLASVPDCDDAAMLKSLIES